MTAVAEQIWEDAGAPLIDELYGVPVVYQKGAAESAPITAVWQDVNFEIAGEEGFTTRIERRVYVIPASALVLEGETIRPAPGGLIRETVNGVTQTFEVLPVGDLPAVQLQPGGFRWLIRTKRVG